ncbi:MAG: AraC family transcriptional regulator ligand-binding domain-containing protein, partial [Myxococcota bacterium]|nr:AraC family transcriptional regulator ligand-binding domain-containing protein [Myxococcota bacterium]
DYVAALEAAARALRDPTLGIRLGLDMEPRDFGVLGFLVMNSPTLSEVVTNAARYLKLHQTRSEIALEPRGGSWAITYRVPESTAAGRYQDGEVTMAIWVSGARRFTGRPDAVEGVELRRDEPESRAEYESLLGAPVRFGASCDAVVVSDAALRAEVVGADPGLLSVLEAHARNLLASLPGDDPLLDALRRAVADALPSGAPRLEATARQLGMSERTLQRRLDERGLSFQQVSEEIRSGLAREYLTRRELSLSEVAFLLGYSELSAFGRAFRRWTGQTPREFRKLQFRKLRKAATTS